MGVWILIFFVVLILSAIKVPRRHNPSTGGLTEARRRELRKAARRARERERNGALPWFRNGKHPRRNNSSYWD